MNYLLSLLSIFPLLLAFESKAASYPELSDQQLNWLGGKIYANECNQQSDCLTAWNDGEDFPSLGIGHFIWYQSQQEGIFEESFPSLLSYLQSQMVEIPQWIIDEDYDSPWQDQQAFLDDFDHARLTELRVFLQKYMAEQTQFIVQRFDQALSKIINASPESNAEMIEERFYQVATTSAPYGLYALIDYVNFKGEGISAFEQYNDQGWGLKQVLENMSSNQSDPLQSFVLSAQAILETRVQNSPKERNENRWLRGWKNRLNTYLPPQNIDLKD